MGPTVYQANLSSPFFALSRAHLLQPFNMFKSTLVCLVLALSVQGAVLPRNNGEHKPEIEYKTKYEYKTVERPVHKTVYETKVETLKPAVKYETKTEHKVKTADPVTKHETKTVKAEPVYITK